jgi:Amidohydrolase
VDILDCNLIYGRPVIPVGKPYLSPNDVIAEMDRLGIAECWCTDFRSLENHPAIGNLQLCEELAGHARLHPVWTVLPPGTAELAPPEEMLAEMKAAGVNLVRAEPARHGFSIAEWCCGELWTALEAGRVPLLLASDGWDGIDAMLSAHPQLEMVLTAVGYRCNRNLYPLLEKHPRLHIEISTYVNNEGLRQIAGRFGAERLIYGSGSPTICPEEALGTLEHCGLDEDARARIAGGNLRALLEQVTL